MEKLQKQLADFEEELLSGDWTPKSVSGRQKSPNVIRTAIRNFLIDKDMTQTEFLRRIDVNSNSYNKFMTQKYKDEWSATANSTYQRAAQYMARDDIETKIKALEEKKSESGKLKRKAADLSKEEPGSEESASVSDAAAKKARKAEVEALLKAICEIDVSENCPIYANCDEVRAMIAKFQRSVGVTDAAFLRAIKAQNISLNSFRTFKGAGAGAANMVYQRAWRFFEQYRILGGLPKSVGRLEEEKRLGVEGYPREHDNGMRYFFAPVKK